MRQASPLSWSVVCLFVTMAALSAVPAPLSGLAAQAASGETPTGTWNRELDPAGWRVALQFTNYNGDRLTAAFPVARTDVDQATAEFGYTNAETRAIFDACRKCEQAEYDRRLTDYFRGRGLTAAQSGGVTNLSVDMPELVRRNAPRMRGAAMEVERLAQERKYDSSATIGAVLALAQTAIPYARPPLQENGKQILGIYVPPQVLVVGKGDCDSKTALVASVLRNFSGARLVGVDLPKHYLMGVARVPQRGEAYVEYGGEPYVLLEPAGPAWLPPGTVADTTLDMLGTRRDVRLVPFR